MYYSGVKNKIKKSPTKLLKHCLYRVFNKYSQYGIR